MTNAAILTRVSTAGQTDNSSLEAQLGRCRAYAEKCGYAVVEERQEAISGSFVLARDEFNELLRLAKLGKIKVIVVDIPDRLGRGDAIAQCEMLAKLSNCRIEYASVLHDISTVEGLVQHSAAQMVSGIERININRRTNGGKKEWAKRGRIITTRRPYGYQLVTKRDDFGRVIDRQLAIDEAEARVVRDIYKWVAFETLSIGQVVDRLAELKIPRISEYDPTYSELRDKVVKKQRKWSLWSRSTIVKIIKNPMYCGEWQYGKRRQKRIDTPNGIKNQVTRGTEVISVPVPAIITEALWMAANEQLVENRKKFYRPTKYEYLLRGRVRCGECGSNMAGSGGYYRCHLLNNERKHDPAYSCRNGTVWHEAADKAVWSAVREVLLDEEHLWSAINKQSVEALKVREALEVSLTAMQLRVQREQEKIGRLLDLYANGDLDRETYLTKVKTIEEGIQSTSAQVHDLEKRLAENPVMLPDRAEALRLFQREVGRRMTDEVPVTEKRKLLDLLRVEASWDSRTGGGQLGQPGKTTDS